MKYWQPPLDSFLNFLYFDISVSVSNILLVVLQRQAYLEPSQTPLMEFF